MNNLPQNPQSCQTAVSGSAFSIHDLKCGNILNYDTAEGEILPTVIDWQDLKWLTEDPKGFNAVHSPMKITIPLLRKLGFKKDSKYDWVIEQKDFEVLVYHDPNWETLDNGKGVFMFTGGHSLNFQYVHELQNLYYSLTGVMLSLS
jgi:hypothetical protein